MKDARVVLVLQGALMVAVTAAPFLQNAAPEFSPRAVLATGLWLAALTWCLIARWNMGRSFTVRAVPAAGGRLITSGLYRFTRNPIYFGGLMMMYAWSLGFGSWWAAGLTSVQVLVLLFKIRIEERELLRRYGDEFAAYRARTPRLIPLVRRTP